MNHGPIATFAGHCIKLSPLFSGILLAAACGDSLQVPIPLESPSQEIDATSQVVAFEDTLCEDPESENCLVVQALDYSDDESISSPPRIPDEVPVEVELVEPSTGTPLIDPDTGEARVVNAEEWMRDSGFADNLDLAQAFEVDLTEALAEKGVATDAVIDAVSINSFAMNYIENSLTFSGTALDLYASTEKIEDSSDAKQLIADGLVQKIGTIPAQPAETAGEAPISFVAGGNDILNTAFRAFAFTLVIAVPEGSEITLADGQAAGTKKKPQGVAEVSAKAELVYTITTAGLNDLF